MTRTLSVYIEVYVRFLKIKILYINRKFFKTEYY